MLSAVTPASDSMSSAMSLARSACDIPAMRDMSPAEIRIAHRRRESRSAVLAVTQPPMLCPAIAMRFGSARSADAWDGSRRCVRTATVSSRFP